MAEVEPASAPVSGNDPVRWFVMDNVVTPGANWEPVPGPDWPYWVKYENDCESGKRTTRRAGGWPEEALQGLHDPVLIQTCEKHFGCELIPDPFLHGGGLHVTSPGGILNCHLDYARHPHLPGKRRAVNLILFCHERWEADWGGLLYLADPMGVPVMSFVPLPGRLVAFETTDLAYHGVTRVTGPAERVSVATYLLADARPEDTRRRALFMPTRG